MPNHSPTLTGLAPSATFAENAVNAAPALIDSDVTFGDRDANLAGGTITVSGLLAEDRVAIRNQGFASGQIGLFGVNVTFGGVAIGTFSGGVGGTFTIHLNSSATVAAVEALLENLTYANVSDTPTELRTLLIDVRDGAGAPALSTASFTELTGAANPLSGIDVGTRSAPAFGDIDGDGDLDFVAGNDGGQFRTWRNAGGVFTELTLAANPFNGLDAGTNSAPALVDIDGDGDLDLVAGNVAGTLRTWRNTDSGFVEAIGGANPLAAVNVADSSKPAFGDFDNDGDLDLVVGGFDGTLHAYLNAGGTFSELIGGANPFNGRDVGYYSEPSFVDIDGDGDDDLFIASTSPVTSVLLINDGGVFTPFAGSPSPFAGIALSRYSKPTFADIDGDGDNDLVGGAAEGVFRVFRNVTPIGRSIDVHVTAQGDAPTLTGVAPSAAFQENAVNAAPALLDADVTFALGSSGLAGGRLVVSGLLPEDRISIVQGGHFTVSGNTVSYDGTPIGTFSGGQGNSFVVTFNGAAGATQAEALIESLGYANVSQTPTATRALHFNVVDSAGNALDAPLSLTPFATDPLDVVPDNLSNSSLAYVDLDGDGDLDLVNGELFGQLRTFRNDGGANYVELTGSNNPFASIDIGFNSMPAFVDIDGDGDRDLILGGDAIPGVVRTYRNDAGTFVQLSGAEDPFAGVSFGRGMAPAPADVDGDGDIDLVFGTFTNSTPGVLRYFQNEGSGFVERTGGANPFDGLTFSGYPSPAWIDIDGDGDLDLVVGASSGTDAVLRTFRNDGGAFTELTGAANPFGSIGLAGAFGVRPAFADLDGDGDLDIALGTGINGVFSRRNDAAHGPSIWVNVAAESDIPSLAGVAPSATFAENAVNVSPAALDPSVVFDAGSGAVAGAVLDVSGLLAEDRLSVLSDATVSVTGGTISYLGTDVASVAGGNGGTLTITFNATASTAAIDAVIERLAYANASDTPISSRILTLDFTDGDGNGLNGGAQAITIQVTAENDAPHLAGLADPVTVAESTTPVLIDSDVDFDDAEGNLLGGTLTVTGLLAEDRVAIRDQGLGAGNIALFGSNVIYDGVAIGTFGGGAGNTLTVTFNSGATAAAVDALIENLTYANTSDTPTASRTLYVNVTDGAGVDLGSAGPAIPHGAVVTLDVTAVDDPAAARNDAFTTDEATPVSGNLFAANGPGGIADSDADDPLLTVSAVSGGTVGSPFALASGALLIVNADGTFAYDPNGAFNRLPSATSGASNAVGTDSFSYTLAGGGSATVTVSISGLDSADLLIGTPGNDQLSGGALRDVILGLGGNDVLIGGFGVANEMYGGTGDDRFIVVAAGDTIVELAGEGNDTVQTSLGAFSLAELANVENLMGTSSGDQILVGNAAGNVIVSRAGNDIINGGGGVDFLFADGGNDILIGGTGAANEMIGGTGDDVYFVSVAGDTLVELAGEGNDTVKTTVLNYHLANNIENLVFIGAGDFTGTGNALANVIVGGAGNDTLNGGAGAANQLIGGDGNDTYVVAVAGDSIVELAGGGTDTVETALNAYALNAAEVENLTFTGTGDFAGRGNDLGNVITGGAGNDLIAGGLGADTLIGQGGFDYYLFDTALGGGNVDQITGFTHNGDRILLDDAVFTGLSTGLLSANAFAIGVAADADDRIIYDPITGALSFDQDGSGGAFAAVQFATVGTGLGLLASDFSVI